MYGLELGITSDLFDPPTRPSRHWNRKMVAVVWQCIHDLYYRSCWLNDQSGGGDDWGSPRSCEFTLDSSRPII